MFLHTMKTKTELKALTDSILLYTEARADDAPDAICVGLADDIISNTAVYLGEIWKLCREQQKRIKELEDGKGNIH